MVAQVCGAKRSIHGAFCLWPGGVYVRQPTTCRSSSSGLALPPGQPVSVVRSRRNGAGRSCCLGVSELPRHAPSAPLTWATSPRPFSQGRAGRVRPSRLCGVCREAALPSPEPRKARTLRSPGGLAIHTPARARAALAGDWNRQEEDAAWSHLSADRSRQCGFHSAVFGSRLSPIACNAISKAETRFHTLGKAHY